MKDRIRLALIGCGAVAKILHLPAIARVDTVELAALVDPSLERARELAQRHGQARVAGDYREVIDQVDAAIVATPNHLHGPIATDLLRHGIDVLVEKPLALSSREGEQMVTAARDRGAILAVGMVSRFFHPSRFVKQALSNDLLGRIHTFDLRAGIVSTWPAATDYSLHRKQSGGGVLINHGVHILDLLLWWLGDYSETSFFDDALGGVESNCELRLRLRSGARGTVEISQMRKLRNTCFIEGERGALEVELRDPNGRIYMNQGDDLVLHGRAGAAGSTERECALDVFQRQLIDFADAVRTRRAPGVPGEEALRSLRLIEACYGSKQPLELPWMTPLSAPHGGRRVA